MEGDAKNDASSEEATLASCLASFFTPEVVEWECPSQKEQEKEDADSFQTPLREALALSSRNVSFSGKLMWLPARLSAPNQIFVIGNGFHVLHFARPRVNLASDTVVVCLSILT